MICETPRVRFAPSPTGYLHVGGLRTALYNYLFAKKTGGTFLLRIEDTDRKRYVEGAIESLINSLKWCGIDYNEGPGKEGNVGPYLQSERLDIYKHHSLHLLEQGSAYYCFCTSERINILREQQEAAGTQPKYDKHCLTLSKKEAADRISNGENHVLRLNIPAGNKVVFDDIIRGKVEFSTDTIDDQILIKSDGYPTYHLANVIDDHLMNITHIIRGEEWLSSTPKHVLLYQSFGWEIPLFAHLPLLLNADRSKLSKRQGDVAVEDYRAKGFLKEALVNFVALLGWTAGDDKEYYSLEELVEAFSLERVNKAGAVFDLQKLSWLNAEHLRRNSTADITRMLKEELAESEYSSILFTDEYLNLVVDAMRERISFVHEILENSKYFFTAPDDYDEAAIKKRWTTESAMYLNKYAGELETLQCTSKEDYEHALHKCTDELGIKAAQIIHPLRVAVSGVGGGPGVYDIVFIIGKEETLRRIRRSIELISPSR